MVCTTTANIKESYGKLFRLRFQEYFSYDYEDACNFKNDNLLCVTIVQLISVMNYSTKQSFFETPYTILFLHDNQITKN